MVTFSVLPPLGIIELDLESRSTDPISFDYFPEVAMKRAALRVSRPTQIVISLSSVPLTHVRGGAKPPQQELDGVKALTGEPDASGG